MSQNPVCPKCGKELDWLADEGQWYCSTDDIMLSDEDLESYRDDPGQWMDMMGY